MNEHIESADLLSASEYRFTPVPSNFTQIMDGQCYMLYSILLRCFYYWQSKHQLHNGFFIKSIKELAEEMNVKNRKDMHMIIEALYRANLIDVSAKEKEFDTAAFKLSCDLLRTWGNMPLLELKNKVQRIAKLDRNEVPTYYKRKVSSVTSCSAMYDSIGRIDTDCNTVDDENEDAPSVTYCTNEVDMCTDCNTDSVTDCTVESTDCNTTIDINKNIDNNINIKLNNINKRKEDILLNIKEKNDEHLRSLPTVDTSFDFIENDENNNIENKVMQWKHGSAEMKSSSLSPTIHSTCGAPLPPVALTPLPNNEEECHKLYTDSINNFKETKDASVLHYMEELVLHSINRDFQAFVENQRFYLENIIELAKMNGVEYELSNPLPPTESELRKQRMETYERMMDERRLYEIKMEQSRQNDIEFEELDSIFNLDSLW